MSDRYRIKRSDGTGIDISVFRRKLVSEGYSVYQWSDPPGAVYGAHDHPTDQTHWIISGVLELDVDQVGKVTLRAGDRDFMPANTLHSARVVGDEPVVYLIGELKNNSG